MTMKMTVELPWPPETRVYDISDFFLPSCDCENPEIVELWDDYWRIEVGSDGKVEAYYDDVCIDEFVLGEDLFLSREEAERRVQAMKSGEDEWGNDLEKV